MLFLAAFNFVIYSKLNKTGKISPNLFLFFTSIFILFVILHTELFNWDFLIPWKQFFPLLFFLSAPVLVYLWFNYFVLKRIERLNMSNEKFRSTVIKVFSFFFLKLIYVIIFIVQCIFIFNPISSVK
jgi:hypothetical protein